MELIAEEEERQSKASQVMIHSFAPEPFPSYVAQHAGKAVPFDQLQMTQRFLPCHYFDLICGSSTGGYGLHRPFRPDGD